MAAQIKQLIDGGTSPGEIAVIYRNHSQVEDLLQYLDTKKIAVNTRRKINILTLPFKAKRSLIYCATWRWSLDSPYSGDELLFEIMHYDFFGIPPIEIAKASVAVAGENYKTSNNGEPKTSLRRHISEMRTPRQPGLFDAQQSQEMKYLVTHIDDLLKASVSVTLQQLFQQLITQMGILKYIMQQPDKGWFIQVLTNFFDFIKDESRKNPDIKIKDLMAVIDLMKDHSIRLPLTQIIYSDNGVNFLTAHGSKGLEFEHVFLIGCDKKTWDSKGRNTGFSFPDTLTQAPDDDIAQKEESRRLFYVALTSGKNSTWLLSYASKDKSGKRLRKLRNLSVRYLHRKSTFAG